jgi:hypothetical protein
MGRVLAVRVRGPGPRVHPSGEPCLRDDNYQDDLTRLGSNGCVDMYFVDWRGIRLTLWSDRFRARFGT